MTLITIYAVCVFVSFVFFLIANLANGGIKYIDGQTLLALFFVSLAFPFTIPLYIKNNK